MNKLSAKSVGLTLGLFAALVQVGWSVLVALGGAKPLYDFILRMHFLSVQYSFEQFSLARAISLVVIAFVVAFVIGWVFATIWNKTVK